jgi:hypothetical protein
VTYDFAIAKIALSIQSVENAKLNYSSSWVPSVVSYHSLKLWINSLLSSGSLIFQLSILARIQ